MNKSYKVLTTSAHKLGPELRLGTVTLKRDGWRFTPQFQGLASRKGHITPERALTRLPDYKLVAIGDTHE